MKQRVLFVFSFVFLSLSTVIGQDFMEDGLYYKIISGTDHVEVVSNVVNGNVASHYSGDIEIPTSVTHDGKTYEVIGIGDGAFFECGRLKSIKIPESITSIGYAAIRFCESLTSIVIPNSVTEIEGYAFGSTGIKSIEIPNSVQTMGKYVFYGCKLESTTFPGHLKQIPVRTFYLCPDLKSAIIDSGVEVIEDGAFWGCSRLEHVIIPKSVNSIGYQALGWCMSLKKVEVEWNSPSDVSVFDDVFSDVDLSKAVLVVPKGTENLYAVADVWKKFGRITSDANGGIYTLSVSPTSMNLAASGGETLELNIESNTKWTVSSDASWLIINPSTASGTGNGRVNISATKNMTTSQRTAIITVSGTDVTPQTITVTQTASTSTLSISPTSMSFAASGGEIIELNIESNTGWAVSSDVLWLTIYPTPAIGTGNGNVYITAAKNTNSSQRIANITVSGTNVISKTITVTQAADPTHVENIENAHLNAYFVGNTLKIESPHCELITLYSIIGVPIRNVEKNIGSIDILLSPQSGAMWIVKGSKSGSIKIIKNR